MSKVIIATKAAAREVEVGDIFHYTDNNAVYRIVNIPNGKYSAESVSTGKLYGVYDTAIDVLKDYQIAFRVIIYNPTITVSEAAE